METTKTEIVILDYKDTSASRTTFETKDHGKISAFKNEGSTLIQDLKDHANKLISVDVSKTAKDDGTIYYNIRKLHGVVNLAGETIDKTPQMPGEFFKKKEEPKPKDFGTQWAAPRKSVKGSAYEKDPVGLAVEVFNEIHDSELKGQACMDLAISIVKQAQEAFS